MVEGASASWIVGSVEPRAGLLSRPDDCQRLYKVMTVENFLRSVEQKYLHFNRVDSYRDFPGADPNDGEQTPADRQQNGRIQFHRSTSSAADYYDLSRQRTYACCFSLQNSPELWGAYGSGPSRGKVCVVFNLGGLRKQINGIIAGPSVLQANGHNLHQIFSVDYGRVEYVDWSGHLEGKDHLPNPARYTFLKDIRFESEKEFRVSLSALGVGQFRSRHLGIIDFPNALQLSFDFLRAISEQTVERLLVQPGVDPTFLYAELRRLGLMPEATAV